MASGTQTAWDSFWADPLGNLSSILFGPSDAQLQQQLATDRLRASGIDPATLQPINPNFIPDGFDSSNPFRFADLVGQQVSSEFNSDKQTFANDVPLGGPLGNGNGFLGLPNGSGIVIAIVWIVLVLVAIYVALKVLR